MENITLGVFNKNFGAIRVLRLQMSNGKINEKEHIAILMIWYTKLTIILEKIIRFFLMVAMFLMTTITLVEVIRRYILKLSFVWSGDLVCYLLLFVTFVGGSLAFKKGSLVFFDLVTSSIPEKYKAILQLLVHTIVMVFLLFIFFYAIKATFSFEVSKRYSQSMGISMTIPYFSIPLGSGLMIFFGFGKYIDLLKALRKRV